MDDASLSVRGDGHRDHEARELDGHGDQREDSAAVDQAGAGVYDQSMEDSWPGASGSAGASGVGRAVRISAALFGLSVVAAIAVGALVRVPYIGLMPGSARDTEPLLSVEGVDEFPSDGTLLFTTVQMRQRPNVWEYLWLRADRDVEVFDEDLILRGRTLEENRDRNLEFMDQSKNVAVAVALDRLGFDAVQSDSVIVANTSEGDPADGLLMAQDLIVAIDGTPIQSTDVLRQVLAEFQPGDEIDIDVRRSGEETVETVPLVLGEHPDVPGGSFIGITPVDNLMFNEDLGFDIEIDSGSVGGPSAGLAFTLAVLDQLTEGELTGGAEVAVTGTIDVVGNVGSVGGVVQKTAAVRDLGADLFLIPADLGTLSLEDIEDRAGDDLKVVPVANVEEALAALEEFGGDVDAVDEFAAMVEESAESGR